MEFKPDLLKFNDGTIVSDINDWNKRRSEIKEILMHEEYGYTPPLPNSVSGEVVNRDESCACGHAVLENINITFDTPKGDFTFPIHFFAPTDNKKHPLIVLINFRADAYDKYFPAEEIIDNGFALAMIHYNDISTDNNDITDKLGGCFTRPDDGTGYGKIMLWAYGISRATDYLVTRPEVDTDNIAVCGHSRLGKTAMVCGGFDERFKFVYSNDSGCGGAALEQTKHEGGETIEVMNKAFPAWFCENRRKYAGHEDEMPFDQHFLAALTCPRYLAIGSASLDNWADQYSEQLCAVAASPAWKICGKAGYIGKEEPADIGDIFSDGDVSYHLRDGIHFFGRADWNVWMNFIKKNI